MTLIINGSEIEACTIFRE